MSYILIFYLYLIWFDYLVEQRLFNVAIFYCLRVLEIILPPILAINYFGWCLLFFTVVYRRFFVVIIQISHTYELLFLILKSVEKHFISDFTKI